MTAHATASIPLYASASQELRVCSEPASSRQSSATLPFTLETATVNSTTYAGLAAGIAQPVRAVMAAPTHIPNRLETIQEWHPELAQDLKQAVCGGQLETVCALLESSKRPPQKCLDKSLHLAIDTEAPRIGIVRALIAHGADINSQQRGKTPLQVALGWVFDLKCKRGGGDTSEHRAIATAVIQNGGNPNIKAPVNNRPNYGLWNTSDDYMAFKIMLAVGTGGVAIPVMLARALYQAIPQTAHPLPKLAKNPRLHELAITMLRHGANPNATNSRNKPAMSYAIQSKNTQLVEALLQAGANTRKKNHEGLSARHYAARVGGEEIRAMIVQHEKATQEPCGSIPKTIDRRSPTYAPI